MPTSLGLGQLIGAISIEIGYDSKFRRKLAPAAIDIRLHGVVRDRSHVLPTSASDIVLHDPKIVATGSGRMRRDDEFCAPIHALLPSSLENASKPETAWRSEDSPPANKRLMQLSLKGY
jgi:hypothetical protein